MDLCLALPDGLNIGGVVSWSVELAHELAARQMQIVLMEHGISGVSNDISIDPAIQRLSTNGCHPDRATRLDIHRYESVYESVLPTVMVPNYSLGTHATCAAISSTRPEEIRVIGIGHSHHAYYYDLLGYYEPMIHQFIAVSEVIAVELRKMMPRRVSDIVTRPCGVSVVEATTRTYSPENQPLSLVYAGRLEESQKRVSDLLALAECLHQKGVDFSLQIVGDGEAAHDLRVKADRLERTIRERLSFTGGVAHQQMTSIWKNADVCVLVSSHEGTSISMLEAMGNGCVPIVTAVSGSSEVIQPGCNGYLADVGDLEEMARVIMMLATERSTVERVGKRAYETVRDKYSLPAYADWFEEQLEVIWKKPARPWPRLRPVISARILVMIARIKRSWLTQCSF